MSHRMHVSCAPFTHQLALGVTDNRHVFYLYTRKEVVYFLSEALNKALHEGLLVLLLEILSHRSCAKVYVHISFSVLLSMYV